MAAMIAVDHLNVTFRSGDREVRAVQDVSFEVAAGKAQPRDFLKMF